MTYDEFVTELRACHAEDPFVVRGRGKIRQKRAARCPWAAVATRMGGSLIDHVPMMVLWNIAKAADRPKNRRRALLLRDIGIVA